MFRNTEASFLITAKTNIAVEGRDGGDLKYLVFSPNPFNGVGHMGVDVNIYISHFQITSYIFILKYLQKRKKKTIVYL